VGTLQALEYLHAVISPINTEAPKKIAALKAAILCFLAQRLLA